MSDSGPGTPTGPRVLVTGGTGYVGRWAVRTLLDHGASVVCATRPPDGAPRAATRLPVTAETIVCDLLAAGAPGALVEAAQADTLLHLAWDVSPGFWSAPANLDWLAASLSLTRAAADRGVRRIVIAGTCAEYDWSVAEEPLDERRSPCAPHTLYGVAKLALWRVVEAFAATKGLSVATGRVFFPIGPGEHDQRLVSQVAGQLKRGESAAVTEGHQRRDFIDVRDVGAALAALALGDVEGPVNIARGEAVSVRSVIETIREEIGGGDVAYGARRGNPDDPPLLQASITRLRDEVGFVPSLGPADSVRDTIADLGVG